VWYWFLVQNTFSDDLGPGLAEDYVSDYTLHTSLMPDLMAQADSPWFDDQATAAVETRDDVIRRSLADAVTWLSQNHGDKPARWEWGTLHPKTFVHQPLGESGIGLLETLFNSKPIPARGDGLTVDAAWLSLGDEPFAMGGGASQRFVADLSNLESSQMVITTGQSGHLFHRHRTDQISPWQEVQYHRLGFDRQGVEAGAEGVLTLSPP
jgi:penicillin G amidase